MGFLSLPWSESLRSEMDAQKRHFGSFDVAHSVAHSVGDSRAQEPAIFYRAARLRQELRLLHCGLVNHSRSIGVRAPARQSGPRVFGNGRARSR